MKRGTHTPLVVACLALVGPGCGEARPIVEDGGVRACPTWEDDVSPLLQKDCAHCHSGDSPAGGWDSTTYLTTLHDSTGKAIATAGDVTSPLLTTFSTTTVDSTHAPFTASLPTLDKWVVDCQLAYTNWPVHPRGIANPDPANPDFHGKLIQSLNYDLSVCQKCHGTDFKGGLAKASCYTCHTNGPTDCQTCHGQPPATGAHVAHVKMGALARTFDCTECHIKPTVYSDTGHIFDKNGLVIQPPPVTNIVNFGALAQTSYPGTTRPGDPTWDHAAGDCSNVYCHGGAFMDSNAKSTHPKWNGGAGEAACGTCHGLPPQSHKANRCEVCHIKVAAVSDTGHSIVDKTRHVDGKVSLGDESGTCWACHGSPNNPAPPRDLSGNSDPTTSTAIGAHQAHLQAHRLRGPIACGECHLVPQAVTDPGHLDDPDLRAQVFPSTIATTGLAFKDGATPAFDFTKGTCASVYCHGGGTLLGTDMTTTLHRSPIWTGGTSEAVCGSCHGFPPVDSNHTAGAVHSGTAFVPGITHCADCHDKTIHSDGSFIFSGAGATLSSTHINGVVDVTP